MTRSGSGSCIVAIDAALACAARRSRRFSSRSNAMIARSAWAVSRSSTAPTVWGSPRSGLNAEPPLKSSSTKCNRCGGLRAASARHQFCSSTDLPEPVVPATRAWGPCATISSVAMPPGQVPTGTRVLGSESQRNAIVLHISGSSSSPSTAVMDSSGSAAKSSAVRWPGSAACRCSGGGAARPRAIIANREARQPANPGTIISTNIQRRSAAMAANSTSCATAGVTAASKVRPRAQSRPGWRRARA